MGTIAETLGAFVTQPHSNEQPFLALERAKFSWVNPRKKCEMLINQVNPNIFF
jgi:hypothetical protein